MGWGLMGLSVGMGDWERYEEESIETGFLLLFLMISPTGKFPTSVCLIFLLPLTLLIILFSSITSTSPPGFFLYPWSSHVDVLSDTALA